MKDKKKRKYVAEDNHPYWGVWSAVIPSKRFDEFVDYDWPQERLRQLHLGSKLEWTEPVIGIAKAVYELRDRVADLATFTMILNDRARDALDPLIGKDVQYLESHVKTPRGEFVGRCWIVNTLHVIDCINHDLSATSEDSRRQMLYLDIVVDRNKIPPDINIFRVLHHKSTTYIHARVRSAIRKHKLRGFSMTELECSDL